jgi:hypothetical protein
MVDGLLTVTGALKLPPGQVKIGTKEIKKAKKNRALSTVELGDIMGFNTRA